MFYSQYLFAIGVLSCLDLDAFYHPFVFASQQILLSLFKTHQTLKRLSLSMAYRFRQFGVIKSFGIHNLNSDRSLDFSFATTLSILFSFFVY